MYKRQHDQCKLKVKQTNLVKINAMMNENNKKVKL